MRKRTLMFVLAAMVAWSGCAKRKKLSAAMPPVPGHAEAGVASWYGHPYHGRHAANGEVYDMDKLTAAHRTLPFGTWVRVENLENGKSVAVRIIDRGPFKEGRTIDLSRAAARSIGMIGPGTARVRVVVVESPEGQLTDLFAVQVGAFRDRANADQLRRKMETRYGAARIAEREGTPVMWRVLVGREATTEAAEELAARLRADTGAAYVVRLDDVRP